MHPSDQANFLSRFFFCWQLPILVKKWKDKITEDDYVVPVKDHESRKLGDKLENSWRKELLRKNPSLTKALFKTFGLEFLLYGIFFFPFDMLASILQPIYLGKLLDCFTQTTKQQAYLNGCLLASSSLLQVLSFHFHILQLLGIGVKARSACCSLIYRKILNLKKVTLQKVTFGKIVNLLSNDLEKFNRAICFVHYFLIGIVKMAVATCLLYMLLGYKGVSGAGVLLLFLLAQVLMFCLVSKMRIRTSVEIDNRIHIMSDVIAGIRVIKMYIWEKPFSKLIEAARRRELDEITKLNHIQMINITVMSYLHKIAVFVTILLVVLEGSPLTSKMVFMLVNIYELLKQVLLLTVFSVNQISEIKTSIGRIQEFLLLEQTEEPHCANNSQKNQIFTKNLSVDSVLKNVNFQLGSNELVAILGSSGSGKSTLLQALLKEIAISGGTLEINGSVSYASQEPWIFPTTIRQNILFGEKLDEQKYAKILRTCALEHDLSSLPYGDNTLVGERGVRLSGGQKSRINLARAVYKNSDIYILDDPLSAVDASVAQQILKGISEYLKNKSVILVTHQKHFLENFDKVYVLEAGELTCRRKYEQLADLAKPEENQAAIKKYNQQSELKEDSGSTQINRYKSYCQASGSWVATCFQLLLFALAQFLVTSLDTFLSLWINLKHFKDLKYLYIYTSLLSSLVLLSHLNSWAFVRYCKRASKSLHDALFAKTMQSSLQFFDRHYSGEILNRFSRDVGTIDDFVSKSLAQVISQFLMVIGACTIVVVFNYWILVPTAVLFLFFYLCTLAFKAMLNCAKRASALRVSPIFTHCSVTMQGLATIRAQKAQKLVLSQFDDYLNRYNSIEFVHRAFYTAYAFWTDISCVLYSAAVIFYVLIFEKDGLAGNVGLSITQALLLVGTAQFGMKLWGDLDSQMTSIERVVKYTDLIQEEDKGTFPCAKSWPNHGNIKFDSMSMRYSLDSPLVLHQISLTIKAGEKIGIVGRTGAGKSSLISALFRLYDFQGTISIDGVDIKLVPLRILRSKLAIIPQDPVLFLGTIRRNLDPFNEYHDGQIWSALEDVKLKDLVAALPSGLDSTVSNFSVGQKQVLCLVRAMLKNSKIVVLDEATANVDLESDELIQGTIRRRFQKSTVLTIAHRLNTVMHSDKILVIDEGVVVEFGTPNEILRNKAGFFYRYVNST